MSAAAKLAKEFAQKGGDISILLRAGLVGAPIRSGRLMAWPNLERFKVKDLLALDIASTRIDGAQVTRSARIRAGIALHVQLPGRSGKPLPLTEERLIDCTDAAQQLLEPVEQASCLSMCYRRPNAQGLLKPFQPPGDGSVLTGATSDGVLSVACKAYPQYVSGGTKLQDVCAWVEGPDGGVTKFVFEATLVHPGTGGEAANVWGLATGSARGLQAADTLLSLGSWHELDIAHLLQAPQAAVLLVRRIEVAAACRGNGQGRRLTEQVLSMLSDLSDLQPLALAMSPRPLQFPSDWAARAPAQVQLLYLDACEKLQLEFSGWNWRSQVPSLVGPPLYVPEDGRAYREGTAQGDLLTQLMSPFWRRSRSTRPQPD